MCLIFGWNYLIIETFPLRDDDYNGLFLIQSDGQQPQGVSGRSILGDSSDLTKLFGR